MMKEFFIKKENIFIISISAVSLILVLIGFLFLFLNPGDSDGPKKIPNSVNEIVWEDFDSDLIKGDLRYPGHMHVSEQKEETGVGVTIAEFEPREFLTYFSNQNHVSIYPAGIDTPFFYGKTKENEYKSDSGLVYARTEYLTADNEVWAVMLVPKQQPEGWQARGFVWIQSRLRNRETMCLSSAGVLADSVDCDPYAGQKTVYSGTVSDQFITTGYEIVDKNKFN